MKIKEVFLTAFYSIFDNRVRSFLTMLGMIIGVAAVILLVSIGNGAKKYITSEFESIGSNLIIIQPGKTDAKSSFGPPISSSKGKLTLSDLNALSKNTFNINAISGIMFGVGTVKSADGTSNITILGTNNQFHTIFNFGIEFGNYLTEEDDNTGRRVVVIGHNVCQNLFGPGVNPLGRLIKVNNSEHRVIGVIQKTGEKLGMNIDEFVFIPTKSAMRLFNTNNLFGIRAQARSKDVFDEAVSEISQILQTKHNGEEDFTIVTQKSMLDSMNTILNMLTYALGGIAFISMVVGGIGIMNIMLVSVTERTREIGIRRAVGARKRDILVQFLVEAIELSVTGGLLGIIFSLLITFTFYTIYPKFDMRPPVWILIPSFLLSVLTGVIFGVWPARKASNIQTIDALRYE
ncbi:MAG: ABC transporter permease [Bacteriovoracaceae bacterium]